MWDLAEDLKGGAGLCHPRLQLPFLATYSVELLAGLGLLRNRDKGARREKKGTEVFTERITEAEPPLFLPSTPRFLLWFFCRE